MRFSSVRLRHEWTLRVASAFLMFAIVLPSVSAAAASVAGLLNAADNQSVTRADFLRAAVKAADLPLPQTGVVPYARAPEALLPYIRAAEGRKVLAVFSKEGKALNFQKKITRGEAMEVTAALLGVVALGTSDSAAKKFQDAKTAADTARISLALERNWLKAQNDSVFGLQRILRGKEAKLLLARAFQLAQQESQPSETITIPIIRVKIQGISTEPVPKSDMLDQVWNVLRRNFLYREKLNPDLAGNKAIEGLVNSLGDPYTTFLPKSKNEDFKLQMKGEVEGIGATVEMTGGILTIVSPLRGSPAEKAGLKPKDQIIAIDGTKLQGLTLDEAVHKVRGPKGSSAKLLIRREGSEFEVTVTRDKILIPEIEIIEDSNVIIVKLLQFWDTTDKKFRDVMTQAQSKNPRGIILDLRNNPGGLLHAAQIVLSAFLPRNSPYISVIETDSTRNEMTEEEPVIHAGTPVMVLINKGSASAAEVVAGALQDAKRAKIVGETTYGKGTVQQVMQFPEGSSLKYTIAEWKTPLGRKIDKLGVTPDVVVTNEGAPAGRDLQMEKAMELLR